MDVILYSHVIVRRQRDGLTRHRLSSWFQTKLDFVISNSRRRTSFNPETFRILHHDLFEDFRLLLRSSSDFARDNFLQILAEVVTLPGLKIKIFFTLL